MNLTKEFLAQYLHLGYSGSPFFISPKVDNSLFSPKDAQRRGLDYEMFRLLFNKHLDIPGPVVCQLTSGWDTRTILSALIANGKKDFRCFTAALQEGDVQIAESICNHFGIPHQTYRPGPSPDIFSSRTNCISFGCFNQANAAEVQKAASGTTFLSGGLGNELWRARFNTRVKNQLLKNYGLPARALMRAFTATTAYPYIPDIYTFDAPQVLTNLIRDQLRQAPDFVRNDPAWLCDWFVWQNFHAPFEETNPNQMDSAKNIECFCAMQVPMLVKLIYQDSVPNRTAGKLQEYIIKTNCPQLMEFPFNPEPLADHEIPRATLPPLDQWATRKFFNRKRLDQYLAANPNPLWIECLASLEMSLRNSK